MCQIKAFLIWHILIDFCFFYGMIYAIILFSYLALILSCVFCGSIVFENAVFYACIWGLKVNNTFLGGKKQNGKQMGVHLQRR